MKLKNKTYNTLKWIVSIVLPAIITFYGVVGATCNLAYTEQVMIIATALDTCLGTILGISTMTYNKGE